MRVVEIAQAREEEDPRARGAVPARSQSHLPTTTDWYTPPPANQTGSHTGHGLSDSPSVTLAVAQAASSQNPVGKGNILWEGTLEYGRVTSETYRRAGWQPPHLVYGQLYKDNASKPYSEFQVVQDADGGISILTDSAIVGVGKAIWRSTKARFSKPKGDSQGSYYC